MNKRALWIGGLIAGGVVTVGVIALASSSKPTKPVVTPSGGATPSPGGSFHITPGQIVPPPSGGPSLNIPPSGGNEPPSGYLNSEPVCANWVAIDSSQLPPDLLSVYSDASNQPVGTVVYYQYGFKSWRFESYKPQGFDHDAHISVCGGL